MRVVWHFGRYSNIIYCTILKICTIIHFPENLWNTCLISPICTQTDVPCASTLGSRKPVSHYSIWGQPVTSHRYSKQQMDQFVADKVKREKHAFRISINLCLKLNLNGFLRFYLLRENSVHYYIYLPSFCLLKYYLKGNVLTRRN
jgi:hypothetical protein